MAESFVKLAYQDAWRFVRRNPDVPADELISVAGYATTYAAARFDEERADPECFGAYARLTVRYFLKTTVRRWRHRNRLFAFGLEFASGDAEVLDPAGKTPLESLAAIEFLARVEAILPPDRWELFKLYCVEGHTFTAIARMRDVSRQCIKQKLTGAFAHLQQCGIV